MINHVWERKVVDLIRRTTDTRWTSAGDPITAKACTVFQTAKLKKLDRSLRDCKPRPQGHRFNWKDIAHTMYMALSFTLTGHSRLVLI